MWYEESDFKQILKATGKYLPKKRQAQLAERLEEYATAFIRDFRNEKRGKPSTRDTPSTVKKRLDAIESAANKLIKLIKTRDDASARARLQVAKQSMRVRMSRNAKGELEKHIEPSQYPTVEVAIQAVESLALYARYASSDERRKVRTKTDKKRHKGKAARQKFINNLAGLWSDMFDELPGACINPNTKKVGGPFIRFVMACHAPLPQQYPTLPELKENAARAHYRRTAEARLKRRF